MGERDGYDGRTGTPIMTAEEVSLLAEVARIRQAARDAATK